MVGMATICCVGISERVSRRICVSALILMIAATAAAEGAEQHALPDVNVPSGFGTNIHFTRGERDLDMIAQAGFKVIRMDLAWGGVERKKGEYGFDRAGYDALTEGCGKRGIRVLYILDYSNKLYEEDRSVRTEAGRKAFAAFAEAAARRYAGKGILWEVWNEPNIKQFWRPQPSAEDYCKLVEATAPRVRAADPSGRVLAPATSGIPFDWLEDCFKRGLLKHIDALSVHPYRSKAPETVVADYARLRNLIKQYAPEGKEIPVLSGEWGYSEINWDRKRMSQEQQAQYLARQFLVHLWQKIPVSIWYDWKDDGTNPNEREHHFGTVGHDLEPKPAYAAAHVLAQALKDYSVEKRIDVGNEDDFVLQLKKGRDTALAVWTTGEEHAATLPIGAGRGTLVDMLGERAVQAWKATGPTLTLSPSPQYLLIERE